MGTDIQGVPELNVEMVELRKSSRFDDPNLPGEMTVDGKLKEGLRRRRRETPQLAEFAARDVPNDSRDLQYLQIS